MKYLLLLFLAGCPINREKFDRTPNGWHVHWEDQGTESTGLHTKAQLLALFDSSMERAIDECATQMNRTPQEIRSRAKDYDTLYTLVDNAWFEVNGGSVDAPDAAFAAGCVYGRHNLTVAFYSLKSVPNGTAIPTDSPSWTIHAGIAHPNSTFYGEEVDGQQFPALGFELTHYWGNP